MTNEAYERFGRPLNPPQKTLVRQFSQSACLCIWRGSRFPLVSFNVPQAVDHKVTCTIVRYRMASCTVTFNNDSAGNVRVYTVSGSASEDTGSPQVHIVCTDANRHVDVQDIKRWSELENEGWIVIPTDMQECSIVKLCMVAVLSELLMAPSPKRDTWKKVFESLELGWLSLQPGDRGFGRYMDGNGDPAKDIELLIRINPALLPPSSNNQFLARCKCTLGKRKEHYVPKSQEVQAGKSRATHQERQALRKPMNKGRSHTTGPSYQQHRKILGPAAVGKFARLYKLGKLRTRGPGSKEYMIERGNSMFDVGMYIAGCAEQMSEGTRDYMSTLSDSHEKRYIPSVQLNIVSESEDGNPDLDCRFGEIHKGVGDAAGCMSFFPWYTDNPQNYHPGFFIFPMLWMYIELHGSGALWFQGGQPHHGTAPTHMYGRRTDPQWACRVSFVGYPPSAYVEGLAKVAMLPAAQTYEGDSSSEDATKRGQVKNIIFQTPEDLRSKLNSAVPNTNAATVVADSAGYAEGRSVLVNLLRFKYICLLDAVSLCPQEWGIQVDPVKFMDAITCVDRTGKVVPADIWEYAPRLPPRKAGACSQMKPGLVGGVHSKFEEKLCDYRVIYDDRKLAWLAERRQHYARSTTIKRKDAPHIGNNCPFDSKWVHDNEDGDNDEADGNENDESGEDGLQGPEEEQSEDGGAEGEDEEEEGEGGDEDQDEEEDEYEDGDGDEDEDEDQDKGRDEDEDKDEQEDKQEEVEDNEVEGEHDGKGMDDEGEGVDGSEEAGDDLMPPLPSQLGDDSLPQQATLLPSTTPSIHEPPSRLSEGKKRTYSDVADNDEHVTMRRSSRLKKAKAVSTTDPTMNHSVEFRSRTDRGRTLPARVGGVESIANLRRGYGGSMITVGEYVTTIASSSSQVMVRSRQQLDPTNQGLNVEESDVTVKLGTELSEKNALLSSFDESALEEEITCIVATLESAMHATDDTDYKSLADLSNRMLDPHQRFTVGVLPSIRNVWLTWNAVVNTNAQQQTQLSYSEFFAASSYIYTHRWLEDICRFGLKSLSDLGIPSNDIWITRLAARLYQKIRARTNPILIQANDFIPGWCAPKMTIKGSSKELSRDHVRVKTLEHLLTVVGNWLGFPGLERALPRYHFLSQLVAFTSPYILLLPKVGDAFRHMPKAVFPRTHRRGITSADVDNFLHLFQKHPIAHAGSRNRALLDNIGELYFPSNLPFQIVEIEQPRAAQGYQRVLHFLLKSLACLKGEETELLANKLKASPIHTPIREYIPTVQNLTSDNLDYSPFCHDYTTTSEGFFSVLLWQVVTYASEAVQEGNIFFDSLDEWRKLQLKHQGNPNYLFIPDAYGVTELDRVRRAGIRNVAKLWDAAEGWFNFCDDNKTQQFTLQEIFNYIQALDCLCLNDAMAYEVATDYAVQTHLVIPPTVEEIGGFIWKLNGASLACLRCLDLLPAETHAVTEDQVISAFAGLYNALQHYLDLQSDKAAVETVHDQISFSPVMVEFALCQFLALDVNDSDLNIS
ncbi:hypothetical protein K474DRAFT_1680739 [Panus rudis PR-1116 ss-1]|nr:hypothetical protein K474DRAFT_1680739 [Panus rudis PR-1116 ss-1]